jgi:hypothetical protein
MNPTFLICSYLKVYTDMAKREGKFVDTGISTSFCKAERSGKPCMNRGQCIIAKEPDTWKRISSKSFGDKNEKNLYKKATG